MSDHTKEPWFVDGIDVMARAGEMTLSHVAQTCHNEDDARRIVACVNACEGISTEQLESWVCMSRPILQSLKDLKAEADREAKQRDEMLAVLKIVASKLWYRGCAMLGPDQMKAVNNAIAKATGDQP